MRLEALIDTFRVQREWYERTKIASALLSSIARLLPLNFFKSQDSYVEPLEPLDTAPPRLRRFKSRAEAKRWVFENFDDFAWIGIDGSHISLRGMTKKGIVAQTGICVYCFNGNGENKRNWVNEWSVLRPVTKPRPGFTFPDVNTERYIQEIEHCRCIVSFITEGKFPCDDCKARLKDCPNREKDLSPLTKKDNIMLMVDFPLEPSWINQVMGRFEARRELLIQSHQRVLDLRGDVLLVSITHGSLAKDYVTTIIDHLDEALWEKRSNLDMQDLVETIENWKNKYKEEAERILKEWATKNNIPLAGSPLDYLNAIFDTPDIRRLITDFDGLGSYFESSGDRSPAFRCKRRDMERFGFGFVTGYYFMPWGGFRREDGVARADDWIRVGFGLRKGLGEDGNTSFLNRLHEAVLAQIILGHGTPLVLARAHLYAASSKRKLIQLILTSLGAYPTHKTLRKVRPI